LQAGESVDIEDFTEAHPEWADVLPGLLGDLRGLAALEHSVVKTIRTAKTHPGSVAPSILGDFAIGEEIGRGGMGVVYLAEQLSLGRRVALKVLSAAAALDARSLQRFQIEAQAAACLNHEHIVPVYAVGAHEDVPYYAMRHIHGASLAAIVAALRQIRDGVPSGECEAPSHPAWALARALMVGSFRSKADDAPAGEPTDFRSLEFVRAVVRLAAQAALAIEHAHDQGILHRDIKPANLLVDLTGKLWVTDFGLARMDGGGNVTVTGDLPGTLRYMSPEQAFGKRSLVDRRSDVYSLGATIYELLTLEPAVDGQERWEIFRRIGVDEPPSPRKKNPAVPVDLATIVGKAMAKDVAARYQTAGDLADDFDRFLEGRAILARPARSWKRAILWCRRNATIAALLTALIFVFFTGFVAVALEWRRADREALRASDTAQRAVGLRIEAQAENASLDLDRGLELANRGDADFGLARMAQALRNAPPERPELARVIRANLAAWEKHAPDLKSVFLHDGAVTQSVFSSDGRTILTASRDCTARLWSASSGLPLSPPLDHGEQICSAALSPDGTRVVTGGSDGLARRWNAFSGQSLGSASTHGNDIIGVVFSHDGHTFATRGTDQIVRLWKTENGEPACPRLEPMNIFGVQFSADSRFVLAFFHDGGAAICDAATGKVTNRNPSDCDPSWTFLAAESGYGETSSDLGSLPTGSATHRFLPMAASNSSRSLQPPAFSPDRKYALFADAESSCLWDLVADRPIGSRFFADPIRLARFSPDGRLVLAVCDDDTARLWSVSSGRPASPPFRHRLYINDASFSPDGTHVLTASVDGTAKLWQIDPGASSMPRDRADSHSDAARTRASRGQEPIRFAVAKFSPDKKRVALGGNVGQGLVRLIDTASGQPYGALMRHRWSWTRRIEFSPDGRRLATTSHPGAPGEHGAFTTCQIWDTETGCAISPLLPHTNYAAAIAFRPDGKVVATGDYSGVVHLWDVESGADLIPPLRAGSIVLGLAFSPDGRYLAAGTAEIARHAVLWDARSGQTIGEPIRFKGNIEHLVFSPDSKRLAIGSADATARLVDVATGRAVGESLDHDEAIAGLAFSPDGNLLLTVNGGKNHRSAAKLWKVDSCTPYRAAIPHASTISARAIAFNHDGTMFATGCVDGSVRLWDVATARAIGPPHMLPHAVAGVAFAPEGNSILAVDETGDLRSWQLNPSSLETIDAIISRLELRTGIAVDRAGDIAIVNPAHWLKRSKENIPRDSVATLDEELDATERRARDAEASGDGFASRSNLQKLIAARPSDGLLHARMARALLADDDRASAATAIARAIKLGPLPAVLDWLIHVSEDLRCGSRPRDALFLLDFVIAARPDDWRALALRGDVHGMLGRTADQEADRKRAVACNPDISYLIRLAEELVREGRARPAADLYQKAIAAGTVPYEVWLHAALVLLSLDDHTGYDRLCEALLERFPTVPTEAWVVVSLVEVLTLAPTGIGCQRHALEWIDVAATSTSSLRKSVGRALQSRKSRALYRAGRFREAIEQIREFAGSEDGKIEPLDAVFLACAYDKLGDEVKARELLRKFATLPVSSDPNNFWENLTLRIVHNEAHRALGGQP
jgi:WD40 repeat protein/serine/threonine protein kinase/tetratricopeptide (TPR) repeat protein